MWLVLEAMPTKLPHYVLPLLPAVAILTVMAIERNAHVPIDGWRLPVSAALMLLIPLGLLIGAPVAFWMLDGRCPWPRCRCWAGDAAGRAGGAGAAAGR
jgi:4-amino-4-deoxy-L-arabinose transferase-like glycosyltransferase